MNKSQLDLPPRALPKRVLDELANLDRVDDKPIPMMVAGNGHGEFVLNFVISIDGTAHAVVLDEDGESGWCTLGTFEDENRAVLEIQAWKQENGLTMLPSECTRNEETD
jgi:hypothetical protein